MKKSIVSTTPVMDEPSEPETLAACTVRELPEGGAVATIRIDSDMLRRLKRRAEPRAIDEFLWENVFKRALSNVAFTGGL